jgi:hypothetical protein
MCPASAERPKHNGCLWLNDGCASVSGPSGPIYSKRRGVPARRPRNSPKEIERVWEPLYKNEDYGMTERYWRRDANSSVASRFNLGLFYGLDIVSLEADAIDTWRRVLTNSPDCEPATKSLANVLPNVLKRAAAARSLGQPCSRRSSVHSYISPIRLLVPEAENDVCSLDAKAIQKMKKAVLREIEFEDGKIAWVDGLVLDRSRAIH